MTRVPGEVKDRVVRAAGVAFDSWDEMRAAMDGGYVPTLFGRTEAERRLICLLLREGYRVWGSGAFRIVIIRPSAASVQVVDYTTSVSAAANQFETAVTLATTGAGGIWAYDPTSLRWINLGHQF
jgi:hypothetical protein